MKQRPNGSSQTGASLQRPGRLALCALLAGACASSQDEVVYPAAPAPLPAATEQQNAPGNGYGTTPAGTNPAPVGAAPANGGVAPNLGYTPSNAGPDPLNALDPAFMAARAQQVIAELVAALTPAQEGRIRGIPLLVDPDQTEINAFAACHNGAALMAVTAGILTALANLAQAKAHDQRFGTRKAAEYIQLVATTQRPDQPPVAIPPGFFPGQNAFDPGKLQLQQQIFDEELAFVIGHELGHHYLGHLPCTASPGFLGSGDLARDASNAIPLLNQPNELAADVAGTNNVLAAGKRRAAAGFAPWTEAGALLVMDFFTGLSGPGAVVFAFERSHPPPQLRYPVVQQTAQYWRQSGGQVFSLPPLGG